MTRQEKIERRKLSAKEKYLRRWKTRKGINIYPHGYLTSAYWVHEAINTRAKINGQMREIIWRSSMRGDREFIFNAPVIAIYYRYLNFRKQ